jgi:hypothetical protein
MACERPARAMADAAAAHAVTVIRVVQLPGVGRHGERNSLLARKTESKAERVAKDGVRAVAVADAASCRGGDGQTADVVLRDEASDDS